MSLVRIENDITPELAPIFADEKNYVITDDNVLKFLKTKAKIKSRIFAVAPGEYSKSIKCVEAIISDLYKHGYDRSTRVYAVGGGVVGDIAGFVSGIYMRGIEWTNIPTTLLAQVDSSIGGKTGIDFEGCKNLIGLFYEPKEVIISLHFLSTLIEDNWISGLGEIIKTCFLNAALYECVQSDFEKIKKRDPIVMRNVIERCVAIKKKITDSDIREADARKTLNVGHTIGHALESCDKFVRSHGEYVLWGMKYENELNKAHIESSFYLKMQTLISRALLGKIPPKFDPAELTELCIMDKKNKDGLISIMTSQSLGMIREIKYKPKQFYKELKKCLSEK